MPVPAVTAVVVSYQTRALLLDCLAALREDAALGRIRVIVVDNGSADGSAQAARAQAPWAEVRAVEGNLGFGAAVDLIAAETESPWLLALNADTAPAPGAVARMLAAGQADPRAGAIAPRLLLDGGRTQHSVGPLPTLGVVTAFALGLHRVLPGLGDRLCLEGRWDPDRPRTVPWAVGACLLLRRRAFAAVGGFDARQWMYAEDLDLCWRLGEAGWRVRYEPAARVAHASGAATGPAFGATRRRRSMAATYAVIARRRGAAGARAVATVNLLGTLGRLAWMLPAAVLMPSRRGPARETLSWVSAHRTGLTRRAGGPGVP
ncbi:MAG TPA: glycosyltransferase [Solirubrobacteraceae bacterium]|nr:glycosyltransferase [Solirubrobacteraceae bacterium]